jgi:hypothetical protein
MEQLTEEALRAFLAYGTVPKGFAVRIYEDAKGRRFDQLGRMHGDKWAALANRPRAKVKKR